MGNGLIIGAAVATFFVIIQLSVSLLTKLKIIWWAFLIEWVSIFFITSLFVYLNTHFQEKWEIILISILFLSLLISFNWILRPIYLLLHRNKLHDCKEIKQWVRNKYGKDIQVYIYKEALPNAVAIGVIPPLQAIIVGRPLWEQLSPDDLRAIVSHEVGHLFHNHTFILYLSSLLSAILFIVSHFILYEYIQEYSEKLPDYLIPIIIGLEAGLLALLTWGLFHQGVVERRLEYAADHFAAKSVGVENYAKALKNLDSIMKGALSKGSLSHPSLLKRLKNIGYSPSNESLRV